MSLAEAEIFDCNEAESLSRGVKASRRRAISRKFDFNYVTKSFVNINKLEHTLSASKILAKLTVFNVLTIQLVKEFQQKITKVCEGLKFRPATESQILRLVE